MLYMVIEKFHDGDPVPVYRRFRDQGRQQPEGLIYHGSWVTQDLTSCYQVMECDDPTLLDQWIALWQDTTDFEVVPVVTSAEAAATVAPPASDRAGSGVSFHALARAFPQARRQPPGPVPPWAT